MTSQSEPTTQNGEAMTPQPLPTTAQFIGDVLRAFTEHGMAMERSRDDAATGARNLGFQLRMAHQAMDEGERTIGQRNERINQLEGLLEEAYSLLGQGFCFGSAGITSEWQQRVEVWDQRFRAAVPDWPHHLTQVPALPDAYTDPDDEFGEDDAAPASPAAG